MLIEGELLPGGPVGAAAVGDLLLYNDSIRVVISAQGRRVGGANSGGNIIDADRGVGGTDELGGIYTYLDDTWPRQLVYEHVVISASGADGVAEITAVGRDSGDPHVVGTTRYVLTPGAAHVTVVTELHNTGASALTDYELGDAIQWGRADHYAPGWGTDVAGKTTQGPWLAGVGENLSYGWTSAAGSLKCPHGNGWSDAISARVDLPPNGKVSYERYLVVGMGDVASLLGPLGALRKENLTLVTGEVAEMGGGGPIAGAWVEAAWARSGRPYAVARTDARGQFTLPLPSDEYRLTARHPGRKALGEQRVDLNAAAPGALKLEMSAPARLRYKVTEEGRTPLAARITVEGIGDTPNPDLGPRYRTPGAQNFILSATGVGEMELPPGAYRLTTSRGIEYSRAQQEVELKPGETLDMSADLTLEVMSRGYVSADLHQSSRYSPDCSVELADVLVANLAEGVEVVLGADDGYIPDYSPAMDLLDRLSPRVIPGAVLELPGVGSISVWPLSPDPEAPGRGAPQVSGPPAELFKKLSRGEKVVQVNHPRDGADGYFDLFGLDPATGQATDQRLSVAFSALEVFNGKRLREASSVMRDWFSLLNQGYTITALGNSDSHTTVTQERGYPRNFIGVGEKSLYQVSDAELARAVSHERDVIVTNGPFIQVKANRTAGIGELVTTLDGRVMLEIEVQAPRWIHVDRIEVVESGEVVRTLDATSPDGVVKLRVVEEFALPRDGWFVVVARGSKGMDPVVPQYKGTTITALGFTNPIWIDVDGDGAYSPLITPMAGEGSGIPLKKAKP